MQTLTTQTRHGVIATLAVLVALAAFSPLTALASAPDAPNCWFATTDNGGSMDAVAVWSDEISGIDRTTGTESLDLPAGEYKVKLHSWDGYEGRADDTELEERFFARIELANGDVITTDPTDDLDDGVTQAEFSGIVDVPGSGFTVILESAPVSIQGVHVQSSEPNELTAICAGLNRVGDVPEDDDEDEPFLTPDVDVQCEDNRTVVTLEQDFIDYYELRNADDEVIASGTDITDGDIVFDDLENGEYTIEISEDADTAATNFTVDCEDEVIDHDKDLDDPEIDANRCEDNETFVVIDLYDGDEIDSFELLDEDGGEIDDGDFDVDIDRNGDELTITGLDEGEYTIEVERDGDTAEVTFDVDECEEEDNDEDNGFGDNILEPRDDDEDLNDPEVRTIQCAAGETFVLIDLFDGDEIDSFELLDEDGDELDESDFDGDIERDGDDLTITGLDEGEYTIEVERDGETAEVEFEVDDCDEEPAVAGATKEVPLSQLPYTGTDETGAIVFLALVLLTVVGGVSYGVLARTKNETVPAGIPNDYRV